MNALSIFLNLLDNHRLQFVSPRRRLGRTASIAIPPNERTAGQSEGCISQWTRLGCSNRLIWIGVACLLGALLPNLAQAEILNVRDFGAKADGRSNDGPAIQSAIDAAIAQGPNNEVLFPPGQYFLAANYSKTSSQLSIINAHALTLLGQGEVTLVSANAKKNFFGIENSVNVTIRSLILMRDRPVFSQVMVKSVDVDHHSVVVDVEPNYADFDSDAIKDAKLFIVFSNPESGSWGDHSAACAWYRPSDPSVCWPPSILAKTRLSSREWQLTLNTAPLSNYLDKESVIWPTLYKGHAFVVTTTDGLLVDNVTYFPAGSDGGFVLSRNRGRFLFRNFIVDVPPQSGQLMSALGGAMVFNNHITLVLDHVQINHVWDDGLNMGANFARVVDQVKGNVIDIDATRCDISIGDTVALWDWNKKKERARAKVVGITYSGTNPIIGRIVLDKALSVGKASYRPIKSEGNETDGIDRLIDLQSAGNLKIIHSKFQSFHARDLVLKTFDSRIEDSLFCNTIAAGILIGSAFFWDEGPPIQNVIIEHNIFSNISGSNILVEEGVSPESHDNSTIIVKDNKFLSYGHYQHGVEGNPAFPIVIRNTLHVEVEGNIEAQ